MQKSDFGSWGEWLTAEEYRKRGYKIIGQNIKITGYKQLGEIDLVALQGSTLVFIEP